MGRQGPRLVPFLQKAMINKMYRNLISEDQSGLIFSIVLPHKTRKLDVEDELLFKDWYALNGKKYVFHSKHYTDAKQALTASLRKSDYVEKIHIADDKLTYRILNKDEVKEKKRLKKELKKLNEVKKEAPDSDDALSSEESGYGSGVNSPQNDHTQVPLNVNWITPSGNESSPAFNTIEANSLFEINDALQSIRCEKFDGFVKLESMDTSISAENTLSLPDTLNSFEADIFTNIQPFVDSLKSEDFFPENTEHSTRSLDFMECSSGPSESFSSGFVGSLPFEIENGYDLQLDGLSDGELTSSLFKEVPPFNSNPLCLSEENSNCQASGAQNGHELYTKSEYMFTEMFLNKLMEDILPVDSLLSVPSEEKMQEQISSSPDAGLRVHKTEAGENIYLCKKCVHLGKTPILFCEPQFEKKNSETSGEFRIVIEEAVLMEINGCNVKEYKFVNDHLMVILEPNDE